jgi:hypothetical protein
MGKAILEGHPKRSASRPGERSKAPVEPELLMRMANEIEDGQAGLAGPSRMPETTTQLLQEHRGALGWSQEEHRVDLRDIDAFVEEVYREDHIHAPLTQCPKRIFSFFSTRAGRDSTSGYPCIVELLRHEFSMGNAYAKTKRSHGFGVTHTVAELLENEAHAHVVAGEHVAQL